MNHSNKIILIILLLAALTTLIIFFSIKDQEIQLIVLENQWKTYKNDELGFEIKYPREIITSANSCDLEKNKMIPMKIFDSSNEVYISYEYFFDINKESGKCERVENSFELLDTIGDYSWKIIVKEGINNDEELNKFIQEYYVNYDGKCNLGEKKLTLQEGVYDIYTAWDGKDLDESECLINGWTVMKYYPVKNKVVAWLIGQEAVFWGNSAGTITYDEEMVKSFKFIN
ncbi:MAG: hypothetical protein HOE19_04160 [Candidatus Komeilibacteria bacterium]|jgi:hypothetical protein|nr:hypothetical protein [Candidatus Komeilibacteria bacterium]MBT4447868.1 hypothetical protein [Candidatus Komeilibacteria bacterium]